MRAAVLPLLLALAGPSLAQVAVVATSAGIAVQAGPWASTVAPGIDVTGGVVLGSTGASGSAAFAAHVGATATAVDLDWSAACTALASTSVASHGTIRYELHVAQPFAGQLVVAWTAPSSGTGTASCSVDLGDDGVVEATGSAVLPLALGPGLVPLRVRVATAAQAGSVQGPFGMQWSWQGASSAVLSLRLEPAPCPATAFAPGCAEPQLEPRATFAGGVELRGAFASAGVLAVAVLGMEPLPSPVPLPLAPGCPLLVTPLATALATVGPERTAAWTLAVPRALRPIAFAAQLAAVDLAAGAASTSAGWSIVCP